MPPEGITGGLGPGYSPPTSRGEPVLRIFPHPGRLQISYGSPSRFSLVCHSCRPMMQRESFMATSWTAVRWIHRLGLGSRVQPRRETRQTSPTNRSRVVPGLASHRVGQIMRLITRSGRRVRCGPLTPDQHGAKVAHVDAQSAALLSALLSTESRSARMVSSVVYALDCLSASL
jgi:hypothetical protein